MSDDLDMSEFTDRQVFAAFLQLQAVGGALQSVAKDQLYGEVAARLRRKLDDPEDGADRVQVRDDSGNVIGTLTLTKPGKVYPRVVNVREFAAWVSERNPAMVTPQVDYSYQKKLLEDGCDVLDDGTVVHVDTGEVIPGLQGVPGEGGKVSPRYLPRKDELGMNLLQGSWGQALPSAPFVVAPPPQLDPGVGDVVDAEIVE